MTLIRSAALPIAMSLLAVVAGYATLAIGSTLVQEVWLGGVSYQQSPRSTLILAGIFTPLCAFAGGAVAAAVGRRAPLWAGAALSMIIVVESTYLYATGRVDGPWWFEAGAAAALVVAVMLACWLLKVRPLAAQFRHP